VFVGLGQVVTHRPVRVLVLWLLTAVAVIGVASVVLGAGGMAGVVDSKDTDFLPAGYESVRAAHVADRAFPRPARSTAGAATRRPAVGAAGLILAGSFATLTLSGQTGQVGFAVAAGILLSAFVMSWLLVPALTAVLGRTAFWPHHPAPARTQ
jgi:uncharacterized membrane protein YdfJ with MMPL/SSD domain